MDARKVFAAIIISVWLSLFLIPSLVIARDITVDGFTDEAVQEAVDAAQAGGTVFFPAGEYNFDATVIIDKSITLTGAAELMNVGVVEPGEANDPPYWDTDPAVIVTENADLNLFEVNSDAVYFDNLQLAGAVTHEDGDGEGIVIDGYDDLSVANCIITRCKKGINFTNSLHGVVYGCYLIENYRNGFGYGISITGATMDSGGSEVLISDNEFSFNRHSIASNSPKTSFIVEKCYFHDNDMSEWQACVDTHAQGGYTLRAVVRDNIFERTRPMAFKSGSLEITGNYFGPGCGNYDVGGYSRMINFGSPSHNNQNVPNASLHDIYIAGNINDSSPTRRLFWVEDYDYSGVTKFVAYNIFVDGKIFTNNPMLSSAPKYPYPSESPNPFVGQMYVTLPGETERVDTVESDVWYDLHVFAVDPESAENIVEIGAQFLNTWLFERNAEDAISSGKHNASGNYFIRAADGSVFAREDEASTDWSDVSEREGAYVDGTSSSWDTDGNNRIHFTARFRLPDSVTGGEWRLYAYARDAEGNLPISPWHDYLEGWPVKVLSAGRNAVQDSEPQALMIFDSIFPNPFNPSTTISYTLNEAGMIKVHIYDMLGRNVNTLVSEMKTPGKYTVQWNAEGHASGVYFCKIEYGDFIQLTQKMILMK